MGREKVRHVSNTFNPCARQLLQAGLTCYRPNGRRVKLPSGSCQHQAVGPDRLI